MKYRLIHEGGRYIIQQIMIVRVQGYTGITGPMPTYHTLESFTDKQAATVRFGLYQSLDKELSNEKQVSYRL